LSGTATSPAACFDNTVGKLVPGAHADVIVVDYNPPTRRYIGHIDGHLLLWRFRPGCRDDRSSAGRIAMQARELSGIDEARIMARHARAAGRLWERFLRAGTRKRVAAGCLMSCITMPA